MTYAVMLACIVASCWVWFTDRTLMHDWGYQPSNPWRHGGLTALTCFFLHLHPLHLLGNMLALWSFGEEVEETLGRLWLLVMLTLATIAGCAMYGLVHADPSTPCIGASGGISGVLTYFCLRFPHKEMAIRVEHSYFHYDIPMSAIVWLMIWLLFQITGAVIEHRHGIPIAFGAHLGGALVGATWFILHRWLAPPTTADLRKAWWMR